MIEPRSWRIGRWIGAATLMTALHVGGAYLALQHRQSEQPTDDAAGAITLELGPMASALPDDPLNAAPGPLMQEAMAARQSTEQQVEKVEEEPQPEQPPAPVPDPEVVVQKHTPVEEKPDEPVKDEPQPDLQAPQEVAEAPQTTAPPRIEAEQSKAAVAPEAGSSTEVAKTVLSWQNALTLHLHRHKRYPAAAQARRIEGDVYVRFTMDRTGQLSAATIERSSGSALLDEETMALLRRASPLPRPPPGVPGEALEYVVPIRFRMK